MKNLPPLYQHQKDVVTIAQKTNELALFHEMGCISGDMKVTINQNGASKTLSFRDAYKFYKNRQKDKMFVCGMKKDGVIGFNKLTDIVNSGVKTCFEITFSSGTVLELTEDHEILTNVGFKSLKDGLKVGDICFEQNSLRPTVSTGKISKPDAELNKFNFQNHTKKEVTIEKITPIGEKDTYDIKCESVHNFLANSIVVHNCGKTRSVIEIMRNIFNTESKIKRTLILGPTAVIYNWKNEIEKFSKIPAERVYVCASGTSRDLKLQKAIDQGALIITINYEALVATKIKDLILKWKPEILICDESHKIKSPTAQRSKAVFETAKLTQHRLILTGTPILKNTMDAFMQFKILDLGKTFGLNFFTFRANYFMDKNAAWAGKQNHFPLWVPRPDKEKELLAKIANKAHVVYTKDCLDLPPYLNIIEKVSLNPEQKKAYEEMRDFFVTFVKENAENPAIATIAPVKAIRMMQICAGHVTLDNKDTIDFGNTPKLERLAELIEEIRHNHKFIVWTAFKHDNKMACDLLTKLGIKFVKITGDQSTQEKQQAVDDFQNDPNVQGVVSTLSAGGTGITLTKASYSFVLSRNFSLGDNLQARARNYRAGSQIHEKIINIDLVVDGSVEEKVAQAINSKEEIGKLVLSWAKNNQL